MEYLKEENGNIANENLCDFSEETWKQPGRPVELILKVFLIKNYEASTSAVLLQSLDLDSALKRWELFCIIIFPTNVKGIKAL